MNTRLKVDSIVSSLMRSEAASISSVKEVTKSMAELLRHVTKVDITIVVVVQAVGRANIEMRSLNKGFF